LDSDPLSLFVLLGAVDFAFFQGLLVFVILLAMSALVSGSEVACFSLTQTQLSESDSEKMILIHKMIQRPERLLATVLVANNFINIGIVLLFSKLGDTLFADIHDSVIRFAVEIVVATFLLLIFGEILPKVYANRNNLKFALFIARPLYALFYVLKPISKPMQSITSFLKSGFSPRKSSFGVDHLSQALELTNPDDTSKQEQKILKGIVSFGNTDTKQVMSQRLDIHAIDLNTPFKTVLKDILENGHSRVPVFDTDIDHIVGILYVKDLLPYLSDESFDWTTLLREPYFVPENKKLDDLMAEFQAKKVHLAMVVDEYGGTSGLVTLEDIIEEIVGDISDEFDDEEVNFVKIDDNNFMFDGKTTLKDVYRIAHIEDVDIFESAKGEADTIAGLVLELSGNFPKIGAVIGFHQCTFTIEQLDQKRIKKIKLSKKEAPLL
jgi:putative hemolysin